jgi:KaiC/GvpD/RAD55 family RecA-like ATPase
VVRELEENEGKKRIRGIYIVKSRGTGHSSDVHRLSLSDAGISVERMDAEATAGADQKKTVGKSISPT